MLYAILFFFFGFSILTWLFMRGVAILNKDEHWDAPDGRP